MENNIENNNKISWKEQIKIIFKNIKYKFYEVWIELTQKIQWTKSLELLNFIKQFTIVAVISIICVFIIDNIIIYILKKIY
jgi:hypothetical protein